ncbi:hypothetical protein [Nostoc sp. 106C]|uniref:hypothetical protein n=1 Tax=Nostoc sp. 106C TaxID=1932667 RepID=UPI001412284E|nr:hypothetical protein [Nostoc sp. 106C]
MSSDQAAKSMASRIALSSSKIALAAFENYITEKLNENTESQVKTNSKPKVNINEPKSF